MGVRIDKLDVLKTFQKIKRSLYFENHYVEHLTRIPET